MGNKAKNAGLVGLGLVAGVALTVQVLSLIHI